MERIVRLLGMGSLMYIYPSGLTGAGLLLLRIGVAGSAVALVNAAQPRFGWVLVVWLVIAAPIAAGIQTRALAAISAVALPLMFARSVSLDPLTVHVVFAAALALVGPGAYSIDSALFGRRRIILPSSDAAP
jgi:putative oxidoreductase